MRIASNGNMPDWLSKVADELADQSQPVQDETDRGTFTFGTCPEALIRSAVKEDCPGGYSMTIKSQKEWQAIASAVNQGIDAHLEAFTRSTFDPKTGRCLVHPEELHVLLRRLFDSGDEESWSLRSGILSTLGIEEV